MSICPICGVSLTYSPLFHDWYCYNCRTYPLSTARYGYIPDHCTTKRSVLGVTSTITVALTGLTIILFLIGLVYVHAELSDYFADNGSNENDDYYYEDESSTKYDASNLLKGSLDIGIAIILLICIRTFLRFTVNDRHWWHRLKGLIEPGCSWDRESSRMRMKTNELNGIFYGTIFFLGIVLFLFGIVFINVSDSAMILVACIDVAFGIAALLIGYQFYLRDLTRVSREIYPLLKPKKSKKAVKEY